MKINFDTKISDEDQKKLAKILGCSEEELSQKIQKITESALHEYLYMILGQGGLKTFSESKEIRLLMMIKYLFEGEIPDENKVSQLFHSTLSQSRSLTKSVVAKYQFDLEDALKKSYVSLLTGAKHKDEDDSYEISVKNIAVIDGLNQMIINIDGTLPRISKKPGSSGTFVIDIASYKELCAFCGVEIEDK